MNKLKKYNKKIIMSTVALIVAAVAFLASVCYAWFSIGLNTKTGNTYTQVVGDNIAFGSTFTAVVHSTPKSLTATTGADGLEKTTSNYYVSAGKIVSSSSSESPSFSGLNDGNYVDVTFSVYATDSTATGKTYKIYLSEFATDNKDAGTANSNRSYSFELKDSSDNFLGTIYGSAGLFKWGIVTTDTEATSKITENSDGTTTIEVTDSNNNTIKYKITETTEDKRTTYSAEITSGLEGAPNLGAAKTKDGYEIFYTYNGTDYTIETTSSGAATIQTANMKYFHDGYSNSFDYYYNGGTDDEYKQTIKEGIIFGGVGVKYQVEITLRIKIDLDDFYPLIKDKGAKEYDVSDSEYYLTNIQLLIGQIVLSEETSTTTDEE